MKKRILESNLQLPALYVLKQRQEGITTTELSEILREIMKPEGENLHILKDRSDDKFSQIVRNLTAKQRNFVKKGFISRNATPGSPLFITELGKEYLEENIELVEASISNNFEFGDVIELLAAVENKREKVVIFNDDLIISEGTTRTVTVQTRERSKTLRNYAIHNFLQQGKISCQACAFNFDDFYGTSLSDSYIEIHHVKPIFQYAQADIDVTLKEALKNLVPLCSNCHRMVHRKRGVHRDVTEIIAGINSNGIFKRS